MTASASTQAAPNSRYRSSLAVGALLVIALAGLWWLGLPPFGAPNDRPSRTQRASVQPTQIEIELSERQVATLKIVPVGQATFDVLRSAVGNIDFNQNMLVQVFTPNAGRIIATFANVGDRVKKGQILFTVDSPDLVQASSNLIQAAGVLALQNANLRRLTETLRGGGGAQKDVDQAKSDQQTAEGTFRAARDAMRIFGKTDDEIEQIVRERKADSVLIVRSPINGQVTQRTASPGLYVQPGNAPAPIRNFDGVITVVGAQIDPATHRLMVRSEIKDPDNFLRAGMFANFTIRVSEPFTAMAVPNSAIVREGDGSMSVWVTVDRRRFEKRTVRTGLQQNGMTQIIEGVRPGELVVTEGAVFVSNKAATGSNGAD
jgi:membrane fusion protein, heavy metal efflux system